MVLFVTLDATPPPDKLRGLLESSSSWHPDPLPSCHACLHAMKTENLTWTWQVLNYSIMPAAVKGRPQM